MCLLHRRGTPLWLFVRALETAQILILPFTSSQIENSLLKELIITDSIPSEVKSGLTIIPCYQVDNVLKNAPHTADCLIKGEWKHSYTREQAAYPVSYLNTFKYWVPVRRVDNAHGDRNLICTCPSIEEYEMA